MKKEQVSPDDISATALKVFSRDELIQMPRQQRLSLMGMIGRRLKKDGPPPTQDELLGIRELVEEHLWHPALGQLQATSQG
jgi:hypothetical protein